MQSKGAVGSNFDQNSRDRIITPYNSAHLGFFKIGSDKDEDLVDGWTQYDKVDDPLGIAQKYAQGKLLFLYTPKPIAHTAFWSDLDTFKMIVPYVVDKVEDFFARL